MVKKKDTALLWAQSLTIEFLFGSALILKILSNLDKHSVFYRKLYGETDTVEIPMDNLEGFKFAVNVALHQLAVQIIDRPDLVGVRPSRNLIEAYHYANREKGSVFRLSNKTSHGILLHNLQTLRRNVLKAKDWKSLKSVLISVSNFADLFYSIFSGCYIAVSEDKPKKRFDHPRTILRAKLPKVLLIFFNDGNKLSRAFFETYRLGASRWSLKKHKRPLGKDFWEHEIPLPITMEKNLFFEGFKFANLVLWYSILGESAFSKYYAIFSVVQKARGWSEFDAAFGALNDKIVGPLERSNKADSFYLCKKGKVPTALSRKLIVPMTMRKSKRRLDLDTVFKYRPARVVSFEGSSGAWNFAGVLEGLVSVHIKGIMKDKVEVIEFAHRAGGGKNYSYAVLMPCSSELADYSRWWIFYDCATDYSGAGGFNYKLAHSFIERYKDYISFRKYKVGRNDFLNYLKSDYVKFIEEECRFATDVNQLMRGALLELLVAFYFSKKCSDVRVRYNSICLGKQLDVVAIEKTRDRTIVHVVECKERSVSVDSEEFDRLAHKMLKEMQKKSRKLLGFGVGVTPHDVVFRMLSDFKKEIEKIAQNSSEFLEELGIKNHKNVEIKGTFVSTELYEAPQKVVEGIEFWTWWAVKEKLSSVGLDKSFLRIIERHLSGRAGRPVLDLNFYKDYFD